MVEDFLFRMNPARVIFGQGTRKDLGTELDRLGLSRVLVLATPEQAGLARSVLDDLGSKAGGLFPGARMHTPVEVTEEALTQADAVGANGLLAIGGGSTIGLAKAIALRSDRPILALPTTYAGSEMTPILGQTQNGEKQTLTDPRVLPRTVIYDVDLTLSLPRAMSVTSGLNAMAHAVEALYARDRNPVVTLMAKAAIRAIADGLPQLDSPETEIEGRRNVLYGAWLAGTCLGLVGMALHHKLCHVLGGSFDLPHAPTHAVILPYAVAFNRAAALGAMADLAEALRVDDPVEGLFALSRRLGAPLRLADIGMPEDGIARAAELATRNSYWNPRPLTLAGMEELIGRAHRGAGV